MLDLASFAPDLDRVIAVRLETLAGATPEQLGQECEDLCGFYRAAAVGALLIDLDVDRFFHMLTRSGLTRLFLQQKTPEAIRQASRFCKISRTRGFLDALAAGRPDLARSIAAAGPQQRVVMFEFEDDYWYARFLHDWVQRADDERLRADVEELERALDGAPSARLASCRALLDRDVDGFDDALMQRLAEYDEELEKQRRSIARDEVAFVANRHVCVEALALLRLADAAGIETREEYPLCPPEARTVAVAPLPRGGYPDW
jgi:hypothetical protein